MEISPDSNWLAYCEDTTGRRQFTLKFKNLLDGEIQPVAIPDVEADLAWANDNRTLLYVEKDPETLLGIYVKKHVLGEDPKRDALVFEQTDKSFYTGVSKSKSDAFIFLHMESTLSSEWRFARADDPQLRFEVFLPHEADHEYDIEHLGDAFIVRSNWRARNFRLARAPIGAHSDRGGLGRCHGASRCCLHRGLRRIPGVSRGVGAQRGPAQNLHSSACRRRRNFSSPATRLPTPPRYPSTRN